MSIRTRFAPSPTGMLHVGGARTAIVAALMARREGGSFILRIDDTDAGRGHADVEASLLRDLKWLGIEWDEGPDIGGEHAPYRQSERSRQHSELLQRLSLVGAAYPCFCSPEALAERRQTDIDAGRTPGYDGRCRALLEKAGPGSGEGDESESERGAHAWRLAIPRTAASLRFTDMLRGEIAIPAESVSDPILMRSDGTPAYHLASVADDIDMGVTHVVRGEDHLSSSIRQAVIYDALGLERPGYLHLGLLTASGGAKLSKRIGSDTVSELREAGVPAEALFTYLLGTGMSSAAVSIDLNESVRTGAMGAAIPDFDWRHLSRSPVVFDPDTLDSVVSTFLRTLNAPELARRIRSFIADHMDRTSDLAGLESDRLEQAAHVIGPEVRSLPAAADFTLRLLTRAGLDGAPGSEWEHPAPGPVTAAAIDASLRAVAQHASEEGGWRRIVEALKSEAKASGAGVGAYLLPLRLSLTGIRKGPHLDELMGVLGRAEVDARLQHSLSRIV